MSEQDAPSARRRVPLVAILLLAVAVILGIFIGTNVLSVLFGVISPPLPPLPPAMEQVTHTSEDYGVDYWKYLSSTDACEVVQYLQDHGGVCQLAPLQCGEYREVEPGMSVNNTVVARCGGKVAFSIFNMTWWGLVMRTPDTKTQLELGREVYWLGTGPQ
jgi:hypothetical protein